MEKAQSNEAIVSELRSRGLVSRLVSIEAFFMPSMESPSPLFALTHRGGKPLGVLVRRLLILQDEEKENFRRSPRSLHFLLSGWAEAAAFLSQTIPGSGHFDVMHGSSQIDSMVWFISLNYV